MYITLNITNIKRRYIHTSMLLSRRQMMTMPFVARLYIYIGIYIYVYSMRTPLECLWSP